MIQLMVSDTVTIPKEEYDQMKKELEKLNKIRRELENKDESEKPISLKGMAGSGRWHSI